MGDNLHGGGRSTLLYFQLYYTNIFQSSPEGHTPWLTTHMHTDFGVRKLEARRVFNSLCLTRRLNQRYRQGNISLYTRASFSKWATAGQGAESGLSKTAVSTSVVLLQVLRPCWFISHRPPMAHSEGWSPWNILAHFLLLWPLFFTLSHLYILV